MTALAALAALAGAPVRAQDDSPERNPPGSAAQQRAEREASRQAACAALAASPWPRGPGERRALLDKLESARDACKEHGAFLATLGGIWLEEGEPNQALLWLERALLLDPGQLGAQADHALALAALGDPTARDELIRRWQGRADLPPLLWARLQQPVPAAAGAQPTMANAPPSRWAQFRELSLFAGHESNLSRSPRLSELTITPPEGPIQLPLDQPLAPRPGVAAIGEAVWQLAYSPLPGTVVQVGAQASARHAPELRDTDWHQAQLAASVTQRIGGWRAQAQVTGSWYGGRLNEPYSVQRLTLSLENNGIGCSHRMAFEAEWRRHRDNPLADGDTAGAVWNTLCPLPFARGWTGGLALRAGVDQPQDSERPGGVQRYASFGLRAFGPVTNGWRADAGLRLTQAVDEQGYSPLLEFDARRRLEPLQLSLELARRADVVPLDGVEYVLQLQWLRQRSNIPVFRYSTTGLFGGLRWKF